MNKEYLPQISTGNTGMVLAKSEVGSQESMVLFKSNRMIARNGMYY